MNDKTSIGGISIEVKAGLSVKHVGSFVFI